MEHMMPDIPRFYTAFAEWISCMLFVVQMKKRFDRKKTVCMMLGMLIVQSVFLILTADLFIYFWIPCMVIAGVMMVLFIYSCCEIDLLDSAYFGMVAFVVAEFSASVEWQLECFFWPDDRGVHLLKICLLLITYSGVVFFLYKILRPHFPQNGKMNISRKEYWSASLIAIAVFAMSNLSFLSVKTPFSSGHFLDIGIIRTLVDAGGIAILYAHLIQCSEYRIRKELESVQIVLQNQYIQYKQSKENIELINYKYHDLKHQIAVIRSEENAEKREQYLSQMEEEIKQYEAQNKTGNKVLDTVLTTKSLFCIKHDITFTSVADGTLLNFMDDMDICSIFGNALDNAIECEQKIPEKEKRLIHLTVTKQKNFLLLRFENYFESELRYEEGILQTTKKEKEYHGYGLKSIRYIVNKYEGAVSIDTKGNWFDLKILIPMHTV